MTYPRLRYFVRGYLHQDWDLDAASFDEVIRNFRTQEIPAIVNELLVQVRDVLRSDRSDADIRSMIVDEFDADFDPALAGMTGRGFLERIEHGLTD